MLQDKKKKKTHHNPKGKKKSLGSKQFQFCCSETAKRPHTIKFLGLKTGRLPL